MPELTNYGAEGYRLGKQNWDRQHAERNANMRDARNLALDYRMLAYTTPDLDKAAQKTLLDRATRLSAGANVNEDEDGLYWATPRTSGWNRLTPEAEVKQSILKNAADVYRSRNSPNFWSTVGLKKIGVPGPTDEDYLAYKYGEYQDQRDHSLYNFRTAKDFQQKGYKVFPPGHPQAGQPLQPSINMATDNYNRSLFGLQQPGFRRFMEESYRQNTPSIFNKNKQFLGNQMPIIW